MEINGWKLYWHPAFQEQFDTLLAAIQAIKKERPSELNTNGKAKLLKRILEIILSEIPQDPNQAKYVQGNTLGPANRHWRRAKFLQRFRLFFRSSTTSKIIIYAWVNDEKSLRQTGAKTDAYEVFEKLLRQGNPPSDWDELLKRSEEMNDVSNLLSENK